MAARSTEADRPRTTSPRKALPAGGTGADGASDAADGRAQPVARTRGGDDEHRHRQAAQHAIHSNSTHLELQLGGIHAHLDLPPVDKLAFYAGLAGAAVFGVIEWPIALVAGVGHLLSDDRRNRALRALGEALDAV